MTSAECLRLLGLHAAVCSGAVIAVLLLRLPLRRAFGAGVAYAAWAAVPMALLALHLPGPRPEVVAWRDV